MATEEHKRLATIIKSTHALLREEFKIYGAEEAWERHVKRNDILQKYSTSMKTLATTFWQEHNTNLRNNTYCRVEWVKSYCKEYFFNGGINKFKDKELEIERKFLDSNMRDITDKVDDVNFKMELTSKVKLLDVGSCYNPFEKDDMFETTAIDLIPVCDRVLQCDFLKVVVGKEKVFSMESKELQQLPEDSFDAVVFSLLLEYLPCPEQRFSCCKKAYDLLKISGILLIVSPDSKHVGANARFMKSWRYVLSKIGFMRVKYEKLRHIHCAVFRKCMFREVASRWSSLQTFPRDDPVFQCENKIYIPQDFNHSYGKNNTLRTDPVAHYDINELASTFNELPFTDEM